MKSLEELRIEIDSIDKILVESFERRMDAVREVALYKKENNLPITNSKREEIVINRSVESTNNEDIKGQVADLFKKIISLSKEYEHFILDNMDVETEVVCYQGIPGSFSEEALKSYFGENKLKVNVPTFQEVFEKIKKDEATYGIIPIDNSSTGGINEVYDLLLKYNFYICGEVSVKAEQNLIGLEGCSVDSIKEVFSHPQGFYQCKNFLSKYPEWKHTHMLNTAISANHVKELKDVSKAAIASRNAANLYGLKILNENINFNTNNYTRFIIISKQLNTKNEANKISIVFSLSHKSGTLFNVLSHFYNNDINIMKIQSRPDIETPWEYLFYLDFTGNLKDPFVKKALDKAKEDSKLFKVLGNYIGE